MLILNFWLVLLQAGYNQANDLKPVIPSVRSVLQRFLQPGGLPHIVVGDDDNEHLKTDETNHGLENDYEEK